VSDSFSASFRSRSFVSHFVSSSVQNRRCRDFKSFWTPSDLAIAATSSFSKHEACPATFSVCVWEITAHTRGRGRGLILLFHIPDTFYLLDGGGGWGCIGSDTPVAVHTKDPLAPHTQVVEAVGARNIVLVYYPDCTKKAVHYKKGCSS